MKRCVLILPDARPINSLWVADRLDLLLAVDMTIVVVDAVYDELTSDLSYQKDREVKEFIDSHMPPFTIEMTDVGKAEREKRRLEQKLEKNAGELAMVDFLSSEDGVGPYLKGNKPVMILFEDAGFRVFNKAPNMHLISTASFLRGLQEVGVIASADEILYEMTHPTKPGRHSMDGRKLIDLPEVLTNLPQ